MLMIRSSKMLTLLGIYIIWYLTRIEKKIEDAEYDKEMAKIDDERYD